MRPVYLSVSQLTCFLGCPIRYRFRYVDQIPPAFRSGALVLGSAVHSALDWLHRAWQKNERPGQESALRIFRADFAAQGEDGVPLRGDRKALQETGEALLGLYLAETGFRTIRAVEMPFEVPLVDPATKTELPVPLLGYVDLVEADGTVVEFKTAARKPDRTTLKLQLQLTAYTYALARIYRERPKVRLECLLKTKTPRLERIEVERGEQDDRRLFVIAGAVLSAIEAEAFFPNPSWACPNCEYRRVCPVWET